MFMYVRIVIKYEKYFFFLNYLLKKRKIAIYYHILKKILTRKSRVQEDHITRQVTTI